MNEVAVVPYVRSASRTAAMTTVDAQYDMTSLKASEGALLIIDFLVVSWRRTSARKHGGAGARVPISRPLPYGPTRCKTQP